MKKKEIVALAKKIAQQEKILKDATSSEEKQRAETEIVKLCSKVKSIDDMLAVDDMVQEFLTK